MAIHEVNLNAIMVDHLRNKADTLHAIGKGGGDNSLIVGRDDLKATTFVRWSHRNCPDAAMEIEFADDNEGIIVRVPMGCNVRIEKFATV